MPDQATDYLDPRQMGPIPQAVDMPTPAGSSQPQQPPSGPSQADIDKMVKSRGQNTDQLISAITKLGEDRNKLLNEPTPHPPQPKFQDIPKPPQDNYRSAITDSKDGLIFATLLGSLFTRQHALGAMEAATGYMTGFEKGDKEKIERDRQKWNDNVEQVVKQNQVEQERYSAVWNDTKISQADKQSKLLAIASSVGDQQTIASLKNGNMDFANQLQKDRNMAVEKIYEAQLKYGTGASPQKQLLNKFTEEFFQREGREPNADEMQQFIQKSRPLRSATAMMMQKYIEEHPHATSQEIAAKQAEFAGYAAAQRTLAVRGAQIGVAGQELISFAGPALAASERVPRGQWTPINKLNQDLKRLQSNPDLRELSNRNAGLISAYAQVISRTGVPTVHAQERANELLNTAESQAAYERAVDTLINEADLAEKAPDVLRDKLRDQFLGKEPAASAPAVKPGGEEQKIIDGKTYFKKDGQWFEGG